MVGWLDIVLAVIMLGTLIVGLVKGLIREAVGRRRRRRRLHPGGPLVQARRGLVGKDHSTTRSSPSSWASSSSWSPSSSSAASLAAILSKDHERAARVRQPPPRRASSACLEGVLICGALVFALLVFPINKARSPRPGWRPTAIGLTKTMVGLIPQELKDQFKSAYREIVKSESVDGKKI